MGKNYSKLLIILAITLICFFATRFISNSEEIVWVSPSVNTKVFSHISKTLKKLDNGIQYAVDNCNHNGATMKILYKNAYGSGFLKENPIPNDLDYSVGINLGKYSYDGKNGAEIAKSIDEKMSTIQEEFYDYISNQQSQSLFSEYDALGAIIELSKKRKANVKAINSSLAKIFENKDYIIHTTKTIAGENNEELKLDYPFVLKSDEILIEDYSPIMLFTDEIKYSRHTQKYLRSISIVVDFFVDIENAKTKQTKTVEIVSESFVGQRFQLARRFFVPIIFTGEESAKYLSSLDYLNNDEEYLDHRLFNFKRHLQEFSNLNEFNERPVKMLKRVLQCTDLIAPALDDKLKAEIYNNISENLNNRDVQLLNDYENAVGNLIQISQLPKLYKKVYKNGKMYKLIESMDYDLSELQKSKTIDQKYINQLLDFQEFIKLSLSNVDNTDDLKKFSEKLLLEMGTQNLNIIAAFDCCIKNEQKIKAYINTFNDIYQKAGYHKITIAWLDTNTLGVVKDNFTSKIKPNELKKMALENDLADVNYKFITANQIPKLGVRYGSWVKYNPTKEEDANWTKLKQQLIKDKKNFNIKRRFIIKF